MHYKLHLHLACKIDHVLHQLLLILSFKKGKNKDDLAPIITFIFPVEIPFQIIFLFFLVIEECQIAASKPKKSKNFFENL